MHYNSYYMRKGAKAAKGQRYKLGMSGVGFRMWDGSSKAKKEHPGEKTPGCLL
jgi:hypothetical protein